MAIQRFVEDIPLSPRHPSYADLIALEDGLPRLQNTPMLLIWGERDWCFTPHFSSRVPNAVAPQAEILRLPQAGHYLFEDAWEEMLVRMREFEKYPPPATSSAPG